MHPTNNFFMRHATVAAISLVTLLMILAAALFYKQEETSSTAKGWVVHTYEVTGHIQLLFNRLKDVELGQRGYVISGDERYLSPYYDALKDSLGEDAKSDRLEQHHSIAEEIKILRKLTSDSPTQLQNIDELDNYIHELLGYWDATIKRRHNLNNTANAQHDFRQEDLLMDHVRSLVSIMMAGENNLLSRRIKSDETSTHQSTNLTFSGIGLFYIIMLLSISFYQRKRKEAGDTQQQLIDQLSAAERLKQIILDSSSYAIIASDTLGNIHTYNKAAERMLGYKAEEFIAKQTVEILHDKNEMVQRAKSLSKELDTSIEPDLQVFILKPKLEGSESREWTYIRKDGTCFPGYLTVTPLKNNEDVISGYLGIIEDISERKKANEEREKLIALIEESADYIGMADLEGNLQYHNRSATRMIGLPDGYDISKKKISDMHPAWAAKLIMEQAVPTTFKSGSWQGETALLHADGHEIPVLQNLALHRNAKGEPVCFTTIMRDITERKRTEAQREELIKKLTESNTELERFAYVASHDMQEPLRMIANFSKLITTEYGNTLEEEAREYIHLVTEASLRMQDMVNDLLEYARVGNDATRFTSMNADKEFEHVIDNLSASIKEHGAHITHDALPQLQGNPVQFMRLMQNLVGNGLKYQRKGNIPRVHVSVRPQKNDWLFSVEDNGIGMEEEYTHLVFEPFKRLHTWQEYKGTGIGLAVCKKIVENHGGKIWVTSQLSKGSIFHFTLPKTKGE